MKLGPLALLLSGASCLASDPRTISLPAGDVEPVECLTVEVEAFMPEVSEVVAVAADGIGYEGAWALVVDDPEPEDPGARLFLARHPGAGDAAPEPIDLGFVMQDGETLRLYPGVLPGRAYFLRQGTGIASLWIVDDDAGLVQTGTLTSIPGVAGVNDWDRHVVFLEGEPFVVAVPRATDTLSVSYFAAKLEGDLQSATVWEIPFVHPCDLEEPPPDPDLCAALQPLRTEYHVGATNPIVGGRDATVLLERRRIFALNPGEVAHADLSLLRLALESDAPAASLLTVPRHDELSGSPPPILPFDLAQDPFTTWAYADDLLYAIDETYPNATVYQAPFGSSGRLLQLSSTAAASWVAQGQWTIAPFVGSNPLTGGEFELRVVSDGGVAEVESAGPGHFLVRRLDAAPPMLVRLDCANFPPAE